MPPSPLDPGRKLRISTIIVKRIEGYPLWQYQAELEERSPKSPDTVDRGNITRLAENSAPSYSVASHREFNTFSGTRDIYSIGCCRKKLVSGRAPCTGVVIFRWRNIDFLLLGFVAY